MLTGKYAAFAEYFGNDVAEGIFKADISTAKKKDKIKRLKKKLLELPAADVGTAYKNVLALETAKGKATTTGNAWRAEKIIYQIQILEMEV